MVNTNMLTAYILMVIAFYDCAHVNSTFLGHMTTVSLDVFMYVCMAMMYVCMYACTYICMFVCVCVYVCMQVRIHVITIYVNTYLYIKLFCYITGLI